jgi:hypothetical protein
MGARADLAGQWDDAYALGETSRSWFQPEPVQSLRMLDAAGVSAGDSLVDVGGGHQGWSMPCSAADSATSPWPISPLLACSTPDGVSGHERAMSPGL